MKCPNCGAEAEKGKYCEYCGFKIPEDPVIINITNNYYKDENVKYKEPEQAHPGAHLNAENTWTLPPKQEETEKKKGCLWWVLVIMFWPFYLSYWFLTSDKINMEKKWRIAIVVLFWIFVLASGSSSGV